MRRLLLAGALALMAVGVLAGTAAATHQEGGNGGPNDFAVGSVTTTFPESSGLVTQKFRFSAHSGPAGEDPRGHVVVETASGVMVKGHVRCLNVQSIPVPGQPDSGTAVLEAELDEPVQFGTSTFSFVTVTAVDTALRGEDVVRDRAFVAFRATPSTPPACQFGGSKFVGLDHGNVTIHNATP